MEVHDLQIWLVSQGVDFSPENRYASSDLNKAHFGAEIVKYALPRRLLIFNKYQLLSFVEVGNMSFVINASSEVTSPRTVTRASADQAYLDMASANKCGANVKR